MAKLCVNIDHVTTVRQARMVDYPDPVAAALMAEDAGCTGITVHLREDRRHIQDNDVYRLRNLITTKLNLEMAAVPAIVEVARDVEPDQVTLVPERRQEITTEGGLNVIRGKKKLGKIIRMFQDMDIPVSLFVDPEKDQIKAAVELGANSIELNTGSYSEAKSKKEKNAELSKIKKAAKLSEQLSIITHAGHGLNLDNVIPVAAINSILELNIGHSIVARAVMVGMKNAVKEMIKALELARSAI